jgi:hypothetical protein
MDVVTCMGAFGVGEFSTGETILLGVSDIDGKVFPE